MHKYGALLHDYVPLSETTILSLSCLFIFLLFYRSTISKGEVLLQNASNGNGHSHADITDVQVHFLFNFHHFCIRVMSFVHMLNKVGVLKSFEQIISLMAIG